MFKSGMNNAVIRNEELKEILNRISDTVQKLDFSKVRNIPKNETAEEWCNEQYRKHIQNKGMGHDGYPELLYGAILEHEKFSYENEEERSILLENMNSAANDLCSWSGSHHRALTAIYPPGGFISWHNNANASGYNILFTWSESGDGQWEHIEPNTGEHVVIPDIKGWQCKYGYYGSYDDPDKVLYHAARTNCLRSTVAFVFNGDERGRNMAEMLIDEIETP
jgi:hypothetical protein